MNSSFSKKRHISEVNSVLESRFIKNRIVESKDAVLNEQAAGTSSSSTQSPVVPWTDPSMSCVTNNPNKKENKRDDGSIYYEINGADYYNNNRTVQNNNKKYYWRCENGKITISITSGGPQVPQNELLAWKDCSKKGVYQLGCMDPRPQDQNDIKRIQGCLGIKQDGYFGTGTLKTLNKKYPKLGGVAKVGDINTICQSQITPVGQSGDNTMELDPKYKVDNPVKAPVVNPNTETQPPEDWVETPQSSPAQSQTPETPAPQLDPKQKKKLTDQYRKLAEKYSSERAKILKKTPTATDDQIKQQLKPLLDELNRIYQQIK